MTARTTTTFLALAVLLAGCPPPGAGVVRDGALWEPPAVEPAPVLDANGGFTYGSGSLYSGRRARLVGDLVTIQVVQSTQAGSQATTKLNRAGTVSAKVDALFGIETALAEIPGGGPSLKIETGTTNDYDGSGDTSRIGSVTGTLTARVVEVLPNGHLVVLGRQDVRVNDETEILAVSGVVDPRDLGPDSAVLSTRVADLRLEYAGMGVVAGKQRPGWFTRVLDVVTPF